MSTSRMQRRQIEDNILTLARKVNTTNMRWLESTAFSEFISAWQDLARYYAWSSDTTLDAHILKLYMRFAVMLRNVIEDPHLVQRRRQQAKWALNDLDANLDRVFRQMERNGGARAAV